MLSLPPPSLLPCSVARVEERTFICSESALDAGPTNNWSDPHKMFTDMTKMFHGVCVCVCVCVFFVSLCLSFLIVLSPSPSLITFCSAGPIGHIHIYIVLCELCEHRCDFFCLVVCVLPLVLPVY
jgi:hypothetical protein